MSKIDGWTGELERRFTGSCRCWAIYHLAFIPPTPAAVDAFHAAALASGGEDRGKPSLRPHYGASYYAAFVVCPDGHKLEAVCQ